MSTTSTPSTRSPVASTAETSTHFTDALASVKDELAALPEPSLMLINLDIPSAVFTALGCVSALRGQRDAIAAQFGAETVRILDRLELYARAAGQAHADYLTSDTGGGDIAELSRQLVETRDVLATDATSLVKRKLLEPEQLQGLRGPVGFRNQVNDVLQLVSLFRKNEARFGAMTPVRPADLDAAEDLANKLATAVGARDQAPTTASPAAELRVRAFTLLVQRHDELRRAMSYLRWHQGDVDSVIPSLYAGRTGRRRPEQDTSPTPSTDVPAIDVRPAPAPEPKPEEERPRVGMPGSDPFIS